MEKVTLWDGAGGTPSRPPLVTSDSWGTALDAMVNEEEEADLLSLWITFLCSVFSMNPDTAFTEAAESSLASAQGKETVQEILSSRVTHPAIDEVLMLTSRQSPPKHQTTTHKTKHHNGCLQIHRQIHRHTPNPTGATPLLSHPIISLRALLHPFFLALSQ